MLLREITPFASCVAEFSKHVVYFNAVALLAVSFQVSHQGVEIGKALPVAGADTFQAETPQATAVTSRLAPHAQQVSLILLAAAWQNARYIASLFFLLFHHSRSVRSARGLLLRHTILERHDGWDND